MHLLHQIKESEQDMAISKLDFSALPMASGFWYYHSTERLHFLGYTWKNALAHIGTKSLPASLSPGDSIAFNQLGMILLSFQYWQAGVQHTWSSSSKELKGKFKDKVTGKIPFPCSFYTQLNGSSDMSGIFILVLESLQHEIQRTRFKTWWWGFIFSPWW